MGLFGKPLFVVHRDSCAETIHGVVKLAASVAGIGTRQIMAKKVPGLLKLTDGAMRTLKGR